MPSTKPDLRIDEFGICSACNSYSARVEINWLERELEFMEIITQYKDSKGTKWDCVIPVSGGKDSTVQVLKLLEFGLRPLCVTATTCDLSEIGRRNIQNIKELGVDHVEFSPNPIVRRKLNRIGLESVGDIAWPEHVGIFTIPVRAAVEFEVPLIIWGENSQNEYGGPASAAGNNVLDRRWLEEFGGLLGLRVSDISGNHGLTDFDLVPYRYPEDDELLRVGVTGLFLGHYFPWDGLANAVLAQANGFESYPHSLEGSMVNYENLDNYQHHIHDYFKFLKYGYARATDQACLHLRRGRISRAQALNVVRKNEGFFPWTYLGKPLKEILDPLNITVEQFSSICDQFTNRQIFKVDSNGNLMRDENGNLIKINYDNV